MRGESVQTVQHKANQNTAIFTACFCIPIYFRLILKLCSSSTHSPGCLCCRENTVSVLLFPKPRLDLSPTSEPLLIWSTLVLHWGTKQVLQSSAIITQQDKDRLLTGDLCRKHCCSDTDEKKNNTVVCFEDFQPKILQTFPPVLTDWLWTVPYWEFWFLPNSLNVF